MNTLKMNQASRILLVNKHLPRIPERCESGQQKNHLSSIGQSFATCPQEATSSSSSSSSSSLSLESLLSPSLFVPVPRFSPSACFNFSVSSASTLLSQYFLSTRNFSPLAMEKYPEGKNGEGYDEAKKEQERKLYGKALEDQLISGGLDDILPHILNIYGSRATPKDFEIYAPDATFEDPLMRAHGVKQIKSAFYSLSKIFSESRIVEYTVKEEEISPGNKQVLIDNKQYYKFLGRDINMISLIKLYLQDGKIVRHEDCWDKKPLWNRDTVKVPLVGRITEMSKRASMFATHAFMGFGKDPSK